MFQDFRNPRKTTEITPEIAPLIERERGEHFTHGGTKLKFELKLKYGASCHRTYGTIALAASSVVGKEHVKLGLQSQQSVTNSSSKDTCVTLILGARRV